MCKWYIYWSDFFCKTIHMILNILHAYTSSPNWVFSNIQQPSAEEDVQTDQQGSATPAADMEHGRIRSGGQGTERIGGLQSTGHEV